MRRVSEAGGKKQIKSGTIILRDRSPTRRPGPSRELKKKNKIEEFLRTCQHVGAQVEKKNRMQGGPDRHTRGLGTGQYNHYGLRSKLKTWVGRTGRPGVGGIYESSTERGGACYVSGAPVQLGTHGSRRL